MKRFVTTTIILVSLGLTAGTLQDKCMANINCDTDMHCELKEAICEEAVNQYHKTGNPTEYNAAIDFVSSEIQPEVYYASTY